MKTNILLLFIFLPYSTPLWSESSWFPPILSDEDAQGQIAQLHSELKDDKGSPSAKDFYRLGVLHLFHTPSTGLATLYLRRSLELKTQELMAYFLYVLALERRGDYEKAVIPLLTICERNPNAPIGELAARKLRRYMGKVNGFNQTVEPTIRKLLRNDRLSNPEFVRILQEVLAAIYERTGRVEQYKKMQRQMGEISKWWLSGPFGHLPNLEFDSAFLPETESFPSSEYEWKGNGNGNGKKVSVVKESFENERIRPYGKNLKEGTFYATTFFHLSRAQNIIVRLSCPDMLKLFLDGQSVLINDSRKEWIRTIQSFEVELKTGWHRMVVKFASNSRPYGFRLYLSDERGLALSSASNGRTDFNKFSDTTRAEPVHRKPIPNSAEAYCDRILAEDKSDPWATFVKAWIASESGNPVEARCHLSEVIGKASKIAEFHFYLARYIERDFSLSKEKASARARHHYQKAADSVEEFVVASNEIAKFDLFENHPQKAIRRLKECAAINPYYWEAYSGLFTAYKRKHWYDQAAQALDKALEIYPESGSLLKLGMGWFNFQRDFSRFGLCKDKLEKIFPKRAYLARQMILEGKFKEAEKMFKHLKQLWPRKTMYSLALAACYQQEGKYLEALDELNSLLVFSDRPAEIHRDMAEIHFLNGNQKAGLLALKKASLEEPTDLFLRQALIFLGEKNELENYRVHLQDVLKERDSDRHYRGVSTIYLLDQFVTRIFSDGSSLDLTHIIAKIFDKNGVQRFSEIKIPFGATIYHLRVVKPNGEIFEPEMNEKKSTYTMSGLSIGDVVEYEYLSTSNRISIPDAYLGANFTFNSLEIPTERAQLVVLTEDGYPFQYHFRNAKIQPTIEKKESLVIYEWKMKNPNEVLPEPRSVPYQEYIPHVQFSGGLDWEILRRHYANRMISKLKVSPEMKSAVNAAVAGVSEPYQRAKIIFQLVDERIMHLRKTVILRQPAHSIYSERIGNPLILLKALYDFIGIPSDVVFAYSHAQALPVLDVPSIGTFRYGLLRLHLPDQEPLWVEPGQKVPFGYLRPTFGGTKGLMVLGDGGPLIPIPPRPAEQDQVYTHWEGSISNEGDLEASVDSYYTGYPGGSLRAVTKEYTEKEWKQLLEKNLSASVRGARIKEVRIENAKDLDRRFRIFYSFKAPRFARREGNKFRIDQYLGRHNMIRQFAPLPSRRIPMLVRSPVNTLITLSLTFPEGSIFNQRPQSMIKTSPFGEFISETEIKGSQIELSRELKLPIQRVLPEQYSLFAKFCHWVDQNEVVDIVAELPE